MNQMAKTPHLMRRGEVWHFKRRVPSHLVAKAGVEFVQYSLKTASRTEAVRLARIEEVKTDRWLRDLEAGIALTVPGKSNLSAPRRVTLDELREHTRDFVAREDRKRADRLAADPPDDDEQQQDMLDDARTELTILNTKSHPDRQRVVDETASELIGERGLSGEAPATLFALAGRALAEIARRHEARLSEGYAPATFDPEFAPRDAGAVPRTTVATLADQYLASLREDHRLNGIKAKTTDKHAVVMAYVVEALGPSTVVSTIDYDKVQEVRSTIARTPANRSKLYPGLSLAQAVEKAAKQGKPVLMHLTQRTYCEAVRNLLKYATHKKLLASNPAEELKPLLKETVPLDQKRLPFRLDQLAGFFHGAFYRSCAPSAAKPYRKPDRAWRFWLPLISLFSGARPNEICQLFIDDICRTPAGTWFFNLIDEDEGQSRKNEASKRCVPVHTELIRLGLLQFVDGRRKTVVKHGPRLFYELQAAKDDVTNFAWYPSKRFNEAFIPAEITVDARQSYYSFRHSVRDALRRGKAGEEALFAIGGWTPAGGRAVSSHYGDIRNPDLWAEEVEKIIYPGLDLSFLYPEEALK
jgi:hypothetical protein